MAKNPFPSFNFYAGDWLSSQARAVMTAEQRGIYIDLLAYSWESDPPCSLPDDEGVLSKLAGMGEPWWLVNGPFILKWFLKKKGRLWNEKLRGVFEDAQRFRLAKKVAGKKGGAKRAEQIRNQVKQSLILLEATVKQTASKTAALLKPSTSTSTSTSTPTKDLLENILPSVSSVPDGTTTEPIEFALEEKEQPITADELMETWNEVCVPLGLSKVREMRNSRRKQAQLRIREHPKPEFWQQVFAGFKRSVFLQGRVNGYREGHKTWKASFDWMVANDLNCVKVMEDRYDG